MQHSPYRLDHGDPFVDELGGQEVVVKISTAFYARVYADTDDWFRGMFKNTIETAIKDQYEFFIQRFGGPPLYSQRKGARSKLGIKKIIFPEYRIINEINALPRKKPTF